MEKKKESKKGNHVSKKALRNLLKDSVERSIVSLELPEPNKKVKKLISRTARKMATEFFQLLKKEFKRSNPKKAKVELSQVAQVA